MRRLSVLCGLLAVSAVLPACNDGGGTASIGPATNPTTAETMASTVSTDPLGEAGGASAAGGGDTAAAAAAAQRFVDEGDMLGPCPFDPELIAAVASKTLPLSAGFLEPIEDDGQVFSGGDVDIVYCQIRPDSGGDAGPGEVTDLRVDVHPGTADIATYVDEEWGLMFDISSVSVEDGTISAGCLDDSQCVAMWQGADLFVALMVEMTSSATADLAVDGLLAVLPSVVDDLVNGR